MNNAVEHLQLYFLLIAFLVLLLLLAVPVFLLVISQKTQEENPERSQKISLLSIGFSITILSFFLLLLL